MLSRTLESLGSAIIPNDLEIRITVVDNNSTDRTRHTVDSHSKKSDLKIDYAYEPRQGRSFALNKGIEFTDGDLVGMIDDDEEVDTNWFIRIESAFRQGDVDFIGGPYVPRWEARPPDWLPMDYLGVIGWVDAGSEMKPFGEEFEGILMGGNAIIARSMLQKVGPFLTTISRTGKRLLAGEDEDMYRRLLAAGARGFYLPDLIIYHHIPKERLTKKYFRKWCFWRGVSRGLIDREAPSAVAYLAGIPRWMCGKAVRGVVGKVKTGLGRRIEPARNFSNELAVWDLAGFFYGRHFYRSSR
jgi:glycosyltransferase involved in cell wall biosynthesis